MIFWTATNGLGVSPAGSPQGLPGDSSSASGTIADMNKINQFYLLK